MYIQFKVRSGGIYIQQEKKKEIQFGNSFLYPPEWTRDKEKNIDLISHPKNSNQKVLSLIKDSSIKGLFSFLMGETQKIKKIEDSTKASIQKLNATLNMMVEIAAYQKISNPHITTFFERKDTHRKKSSFSDNPSVNLFSYSFREADSTVKLFEEPLKNIFQTDNLGEINKAIEKSKVKNTDPHYKSLQASNTDNIPDTNLGKKIKKYFFKMKSQEKPLYEKTLEIIAETNNLCLKNIDFKIEFEQAIPEKFSVFEMPQQTKHWVTKEYHSFVRGTPAFIACVDFDIYLSESSFEDKRDSSKHWSWNEVIEKLRQGPNLARWGEGGVVFIHYDGLDEIGNGYEEKDNMFVEIKDLRNAGMKIKKYDWEESNESKTKEQ